MRRKRIIEMSSFGDDPIKDLGFVVFPAYAGMIPQPRCGKIYGISVPRIRGDDPDTVAIYPGVTVCSPHTRG